MLFKNQIIILTIVNYKKVEFFQLIKYLKSVSYFNLNFCILPSIFYVSILIRLLLFWASC